MFSVYEHIHMTYCADECTNCVGLGTSSIAGWAAEDIDLFDHPSLRVLVPCGTGRNETGAHKSP